MTLSGGSLVDASAAAPFKVKRLYYIYGVGPGAERGFHAHRELNQIAACVRGSCKFLIDNGIESRTVTLDRPTTWLTLPPMIWRVMSGFSPDCVLLVLASEYYDPNDYISDREEFRRLTA